MKGYRYKTKTAQEGTISAPLDPALFNTEVDVIKLQKEDKTGKAFTAKDFVEKWKGFLIKTNTDNSDPEKL